MKQSMITLWRDESAQGATEYILMLVIVIGIATTFKKQIMGIIGLKIDGLGDELNNFRSEP